MGVEGRKPHASAAQPAWLRLDEAKARLLERGIPSAAAQEKLCHLIGPGDTGAVVRSDGVLHRFLRHKIWRLPQRPDIPSNTDLAWLLPPKLDFEASTIFVPRRLTRGERRLGGLTRQTTLIEVSSAAIDQLCPPSTRRGARAKVNWLAVERRVCELMDHHGDFAAEDPEWNAQERLVEKLTEEFDRVDASTMRRKMPPMVRKWRAGKIGA